MRLIKFRVYNPEMEQMMYDLTIENISNIRDTSGGMHEHQLSLIYDWDKLIWMQYTGLKDSNGKDIYEGDVLEYFIINDEEKDFMEVKFSGGSFVVGKKDWCLLKEDLDLPHLFKIKSVGNIHTHSFLLIESGSNFTMEGSDKVYECVGTDEGYIWYTEDEYSEAKKADPITCKLIQGGVK